MAGGKVANAASTHTLKDKQPTFCTTAVVVMARIVWIVEMGKARNHTAKPLVKNN